MKKLFFKLSQVIKNRKKNLPKDSYVAKLFKKGKVKIANKLGYKIKLLGFSEIINFLKSSISPLSLLIETLISFS